MDRFVVTVYAPNVAKFQTLTSSGFDVFPPVRPLEDGRRSIAGFATLEEIGRLVAAGFHVLVERNASALAFDPKEVVDFDAWYARRKARR